MPAGTQDGRHELFDSRTFYSNSARRKKKRLPFYKGRRFFLYHALCKFKKQKTFSLQNWRCGGRYASAQTATQPGVRAAVWRSGVPAASSAAAAAAKAGVMRSPGASNGTPGG